MRAGNLWASGWRMATSKQLQFIATDAMALEVREGLSANPKRLPAKLFYDEIGSELFEQITELPEYYLTRTERSILERFAGEILQQAGPSLTLVELGAGTASKTCILIEELLQRQSRALFYPIDVSPSALDEAMRQLGRQFPSLRVSPIVADYTGGVPALEPHQRTQAGAVHRLQHRELRATGRRTHSAPHPADAAAGRCAPAGRRLRQEPEDTSARLRRLAGHHRGLQQEHPGALNRELDADFDLDLFRHVALWNRRHSRMEIYLESMAAQSVFIPALDMDLSFEPEERIHTENSYKYTDEMIESILRQSGFTLEQTWCDRKKWFGVHLARV